MVSSLPVVIIGDSGNAGCYLLLIQLKRDQEVRFGRFSGGRAVHLTKGFYLYIGSAKGKQGASSLGYRLMRHATRSGKKLPHRIRKQLHVLLQNAEVVVKVPSGKRLHWHIDHLLDMPDAEIQGVVAVRDPAIDEKLLAEKLIEFPETSIPAKGLGAGDHPRGTHLLQVENAVSVWLLLPDWISRRSS